MVSREFTPRRVEALRPAIVAMVDGILDGLADAGGGDVMDVLAFPLPVKVIGELLGVQRGIGISSVGSFVMPQQRWSRWSIGRRCNGRTGE